jgi:succinyl-diaminopimelate desuccinylase
MTDLLDLTAELVDIRSESHHEAEITDWIEARLQSRAPWLRLDRVGNNLVARTQLGRPMRLVLAGHTDTVPIADNVPSRREGDVLWGCGTSDMKAGIAVMVELACTVSEPAADVTYVFYEAEEVAAQHNGLGRLFSERPELLEGDVALLGEPTNGEIEAGCQGIVRFWLTLAGKRAHTARPWMGRNAIHRVGRVLAALESWQGREPFVDGCQYRESLQAVRIEGGIAGNVVPDAARVLIAYRFAPDRNADEAMNSVLGLLGDAVEPEDTIEMDDVSPAAQPGLSHPLLTALVQRNDLVVNAKLGWTDVARFAEHGIPATNFGPGDATLAHMRDERVQGAVVERTYRMLRALLETGA